MAPQLNIYQRISAEAARWLAVAVWIMVLFMAYEWWGGLHWTAEQEFNFHPPFMLLGLVVLPLNAALIYRTTPTVPHNTQKYIHAALHTTSLICMLIGGVAVLKSHIDLGFANFYSIHSWIGTTTILLFLIQYSLGLSAFLYPGFARSLRIRLVPYHSWFGILIAVCSCVTALLGLQERMCFGQQAKGFDKWGAENMLADAAALLLLFTLIFFFLAITVPSGHEAAIKNRVIDLDSPSEDLQVNEERPLLNELDSRIA